MPAKKRRIRAHELIQTVLDAGSVTFWDHQVDITKYEPEYQEQLRQARHDSGCDESVVTGRGSVKGRQVAFVVSEFNFMGGSIGKDAAERIIAAIRRATAEQLPLVASTASGGTRMQEGTPAFVKMIDISRAIMDHKANQLPYLVHLRHPTTGGVFASWGSLGHITIAEPDALVGFLGPKVYELLNGEPFPAGIQRSEHLVASGVIDAVVSTDELPTLVDNALTLLTDSRISPQLQRRPHPTGPPPLPPWESVLHTRKTRRTGVRDVLRLHSDITLRLQGTDEGERASAILVALARLDGMPCVVVGQDRERQTPETPLGPAALREARRGMKLAQELGLPLVTFIDTPGAELSPEAEEKAMAGEIARCIATMTSLTVPTIAVLLGQGCGGGALALLGAQVTVATETSWLAPLPLEGASAIMYGHTDAAPQFALSQKIDAHNLRQAGVIHELITEYTDDSVEELAAAVAAEVSFWLRQLCTPNE